MGGGFCVTTVELFFDGFIYCKETKVAIKRNLKGNGDLLCVASCGPLPFSDGPHEAFGGVLRVLTESWGDIFDGGGGDLPI